MPAESGSAPSPLGRRLAIAATCVASLALCCGLAWWQWDRFMSASGTFQNLGYVLQWPLFGLFPAFMFWRIKQLRERERAGQSESADPSGTPADPAPVAVPAPRPAAPPPAEEDDELAAYNRYLRELYARDQQS